MKRFNVRRSPGLVRSAGAVSAVLALAVSGCSAGAGGSSTGGSSSDVVLDSMKPVTSFDGPVEAFEPPAEKHIMVLACGNFGLGCVREAEAVKEAGEELGWRVDVVDGRLDPTVWNRAVKQAVDSGIDGIVSAAADPNLMGEAMKKVSEADVPFVMISQGPKDGDVDGVQSWISLNPVGGGKAVAEWVVEDSGEAASVLLLDLPDFPDIMKRNNTIAETLEQDCGECTIHRAEVSSQTVGTSLAPLVTAQLQQHPDVNYVWTPDDSVGDFVAQGIQQAGKSATVKLASISSSTPASIGRLESGTQAADLLFDDTFMGWLAVDSLARTMAGVPTQEVWEVPNRLFTSQNIEEANDDIKDVGWTMDYDYKAEFREMWGL